jgi:hypothetical protein
MRQLLDLFPMRISALRPNNGGPIKTTICDLALPDTLAPPGRGRLSLLVAPLRTRAGPPGG